MPPLRLTTDALSVAAPVGIRFRDNGLRFVCQRRQIPLVSESALRLKWEQGKAVGTFLAMGLALLA